MGKINEDFGGDRNGALCFFFFIHTFRKGRARQTNPMGLRTKKLTESAGEDRNLAGDFPLNQNPGSARLVGVERCGVGDADHFPLAA